MIFTPVASGPGEDNTPARPGSSSVPRCPRAVLLALASLVPEAALSGERFSLSGERFGLSGERQPRPWLPRLSLPTPSVLPYPVCRPRRPPPAFPVSQKRLRRKG